MDDFENVELAFSNLSKCIEKMIIEKLKCLANHKWGFKGRVTYPNLRDVDFELGYIDKDTDEKYCIKGYCYIGERLIIREATFEFELFSCRTEEFICFKYSINNKKEITDIEAGINKLLEDNRSYRYFCEDYERYTRQDPFEYIKGLIMNQLIDFEETVYDEGYGPTFYYIGEFGEDYFEIVVDESNNCEDEDYYGTSDYIRINVSDRFLFSYGGPYSEDIRSLMPLIKQATIPVDDFLVRTNSGYCINKAHHLQRIKALVCVDDDISIKEVAAEALFCLECNQYFISEVEYNKLCKQGRICSRVITLDEYRKIQESGFNTWAERSLLRSYGYTVNSQDNLSDDERHRILSFIVENNIMTIDEVVNFIEWLINRSAEKKYDNARQKWNRDIQYIRSYKPIKGVVRVKNIYRKNA